MPIALLRALQLEFLYLKGQRLARDFLIPMGQPDLDKAERAARLLPGRTDAKQKLVALREALAHCSQLAPQPREPLPPEGDLLGLPPLAFGQHVEFALVLVEFHLYRVAHLLPRQIQPFLLLLIDLAFGRARKIERLPLGLAHLLQAG